MTLVAVKTAKNSAALAPMLVQKTCRKPIEENHSQSTRKSLASPSTIRPIPAKMATTTNPGKALRLGAFCAGPVIPIVMV
jgi:hypothetical protein